MCDENSGNSSADDSSDESSVTGSEQGASTSGFGNRSRASKKPVSKARWTKEEVRLIFAWKFQCYNKPLKFLSSGWAVEALGGVARWQLGGCLRLLSSPLWHPMPAALAESGQSWAHQGTMDERGESVLSFGAKSAERDVETVDKGRNPRGRFYVMLWWLSDFFQQLRL